MVCGIQEHRVWAIRGAHSAAACLSAAACTAQLPMGSRASVAEHRVPASTLQLPWRAGSSLHNMCPTVLPLFPVVLTLCTTSKIWPSLRFASVVACDASCSAGSATKRVQESCTAHIFHG